MSRLSTPEIDVKDLYFQRVFHEVLLCFSGETESSGFVSLLQYVVAFFSYYKNDGQKYVLH